MDQLRQVFETMGGPLLRDIWHGFNVCLMAYGQTGSGKTHTVLGLLPLLLGCAGLWGSNQE